MLARPLELKSFSNLWRFVSRLVTSRKFGTFLFSVWVCQTKTWNGNDETLWELNLEDIFKYMIKGSYRLPSTSRYFKLSHLQNQLNVVSLHSNTIQKTMTKQNKTDPTPKRAQNSFSQLFTKFASLKSALPETASIKFSWSLKTQQTCPAIKCSHCCDQREPEPLPGCSRQLEAPDLHRWRWEIAGSSPLRSLKLSQFTS